MFTVFLLLAALVATSAARRQSTAAAAAGDGLFGGSLASEGLTSRPGLLRQRAAAVNFARLGSLVAGQRFSLGTFADKPLTGVINRIESQGAATTWVGKVDGDPLSDLTMSVVDGVMAFSANVNGRHYSATPLANGSYQVDEVDPASLPDTPDARPVPPGGSGVRSAGDGPTAASDDGSTIDVYVVYTAAALANAGATTAAMTARINVGIAETNQAYINSGVVQRVRLVGSSQVAYTETADMNLTLDRLTAPNDGVMVTNS